MENSRAMRPCVDNGDAEIWSRYDGRSPAAGDGQMVNDEGVTGSEDTDLNFMD